MQQLQQRFEVVVILQPTITATYILSANGENEAKDLALGSFQSAINVSLTEGDYQQAIDMGTANASVSPAL
jgi:hypothetical protein